MGVTIKEIAKIVGVSTGTVDRALHNRNGVNKEIAQKINEVAKELNYKPNNLAKGLANAKKQISIGIIINSLGNEFFDDVIDGINKAKSELSGYPIILHTTVLKGYDVKNQLEEIDRLIEENINGLVITPISHKDIKDRLNDLVKNNIQVVTINNDINGVDKLCFIGCNYIKSGQIAAAMLGLIAKDGDLVGIISGSHQVLGHNLRIEGFKTTLEDKYKSINILEPIYNNDDENESYDKTKELLEKNPEITALYFCAGGVEGGLRAVKQLNLHNKIKIITVDQTKIVKKNLKENIICATITQQPTQQGYLGIKVLFNYLFHNKKPKEKKIFTQNEIKLCVNID